MLKKFKVHLTGMPSVTRPKFQIRISVWLPFNGTKEKYEYRFNFTRLIYREKRLSHLLSTVWKTISNNIRRTYSYVAKQNVHTNEVGDFIEEVRDFKNAVDSTTLKVRSILMDVTLFTNQIGNSYIYLVCNDSKVTKCMLLREMEPK